MKYFLGIDIGSVSVKIIILDEFKNILFKKYQRHNGAIQDGLIENLEFIKRELGLNIVDIVSFTGKAGEIIGKELNLPYYNEGISIIEATKVLTPEINTIIELGGEDSKLIFLRKENNHIYIDNFFTNGLCAAGTGSFLDQQSHRLGIDIENEFATYALKSKNAPRIAGRCSVFAKSDMIHLQQVGTPVEDILYGLCLAVARNFKSTIGKGYDLKYPAAFIGGVAFNKAMIKAFRQIYKADKTELIVPEFHAFYPSMGSILNAINKQQNESLKLDEIINRIGTLKSLASYDDNQNLVNKPLVTSRYFDLFSPPKDDNIEKLKKDKFFRLDDHKKFNFDKYNGKLPINVFLGIDIGSVSTNLVLIDENNNLITKRYLMTSGQPLEAVKIGLASIYEEVGDKVKVLGAGTTGSGRYMIADFIGGDLVKNEITAQAKAAVLIDPEVDTIFEIGGQDSKYISLNDGVIVDFEMNKVCAAGTGSFLEEQAEQFGINIKNDFAKIAFSSKNPAKLGERCTVFIESDVKKFSSAGAKTEDLFAGLAYSIVYNYLNKVVAHRKIGDKIFFQGGVANNPAVCAAFENVLGKKIIVPQNNNVTGAIGIAALVKEKYFEEKFKTKFYGFDLSNIKYTTKVFTCYECENLCEIHQISIENRKPLFYGSRCEKYNVHTEKKEVLKDIPDFFKIQYDLLTKDYIDEPLVKKKKEKVGIPLMLIMHEYLPMWKSFFQLLGYEVVITGITNKKIINKGLERFTTDTCFPVKVAMGHIEELLDKDIDYIFIPNFINPLLKFKNMTHNHACPLIQSLPDLAFSVFNFDDLNVKILRPNIQLKYGIKNLIKEFRHYDFFQQFSKKLLKKVFEKSIEVQENYYRQLEIEGKKALDYIKNRGMGVVFIGRSYNIGDPGINMNLPEKLRNLGVVSIPMCFLKLDDVDISKDYPNMYWHYGQKILAASKKIKKDINLFAIYITNFGCGADSYILPYTEREFNNKPMLALEIDEHSADAGIITRCEAFLDSISKLPLSKRKANEYKVPNPYFKKEKLYERIIYIPHMGDPAYGVAAAFRAYGIDARVFPPSDIETLELGRKYSTGKECYPYLVTLGDIIKIIKKHDGKHEKLAFFLPSATGPCRYGQYHFMQNLILTELGYKNVYFINPNQGYNFWEELQITDKTFPLFGFKCLLFFEFLDKLVRETRPYEINEGQTDKVYQELIKYVTSYIEQKKDPIDLVDYVKQQFANIPTKNKGSFPKVGIVGEIFVRNHEFSNDFLARKLEKRGVEVWLPTISEWAFFTNYTRKFHSLIRKDYKLYISTVIADFIQKKMEKKLEKLFEDVLYNSREPDTKDLIDFSKIFISPQYESEATLTIAKGYDFFKKGAKGIINTMPFGCMPGNIVTTLTDDVRKMIGNIPWLNLAYDGNGFVDHSLKIDTFLYQVFQLEMASKKNLRSEKERMYQ